MLLPVLGDQYGKALENGEIKIIYAGGRFQGRYYDWMLPVAPRTWSAILQPALERVRDALGESEQRVMELESMITAISCRGAPKPLPPWSKNGRAKRR